MQAHTYACPDSVAASISFRYLLAQALRISLGLRYHNLARRDEGPHRLLDGFETGVPWVVPQPLSAFPNRRARAVSDVTRRRPHVLLVQALLPLIQWGVGEPRLPTKVPIHGLRVAAHRQSLRRDVVEAL